MTKTNILLVLIFLCLYACSNNQTDSNNSAQAKIEATEPQVEEEKATVTPDSIPTPTGYTVLAEASGQLNNDEAEEKVIIYETNRDTEFGKEREIQVFRLVNNQWELWHQSTSAVLPSLAGGTFGDPFEALSIERKCIVINHFGGSRYKWHYTHRFRHQNEDWQLIGATVNFGAICDSWEDLDYNLSNGNIIYEKKTETCENDEIKKTTIDQKINLTQKLTQLPSMSNFTPGENPVVLSDDDNKFYY